MEQLANASETIIAQIIAWAPKLVSGILILIIGFWIVGILTKLISRAFERSGLDKDVIPFLNSLISVLLKILVILSAASVVGIEITAFAALLAGAGLAIGAAMSGTLGHFASGVMILLFKPYRVGDLVDIQGQMGHVREIQVFNTIITTLDSKRVIIPNGVAMSGIMTNYTAEGKLRVDLTVAMPYEEDFNKIQNIIKGALDKVEKRLPDEPTIQILEFSENNLKLAVWPYATAEDYWDVYFDSYREIKAALSKEDITVAYPTRRIKDMK